MYIKRILLVVVVVGLAVLAVGFGFQRIGLARSLSRSSEDSTSVTTVPYQGRLFNDAGQAVVDGGYDFTFTLYASESAAGEPLWAEVQEGVLVQAGDFATVLGRVVSLPVGILGGAPLWLSVAVRGPDEADFTALTPRQRLIAAATPSSPTGGSGASCPHDHFGETWVGSADSFGLSVVNNAPVGAKGIYGFGDDSGIVGFSPYGKGVVGQSNHGAGVVGWGAWGGGVFVPAILAEGSGIIQSTADSVLYLSPHDIMLRHDDQSLVSITPLQGGGVRIRNETGTGTSHRYLSIPVSTFGTLFGAPVYVKSLKVCYKSPATFTYIAATTVSKNDGTETGEAYYIHNTTSRASVAYECYTLDASTPRMVIDNSSWVQFNMTFAESGSGVDIYIYTVELTLTEKQN